MLHLLVASNRGPCKTMILRPGFAVLARPAAVKSFCSLSDAARTILAPHLPASIKHKRRCYVLQQSRHRTT